MQIKFTTASLEGWYVKPVDQLKKLPFGADILKKYKKAIKILQTVEDLNQLKLYKSLSLEPMVKEKKRNGQYAVRLNDQYRLHFTPDKEAGKVIISVEEITKHYEKIT